MQDASDSRVWRRRVFYIPGYDPIHPRRYRELFRKEGKEQARISGYELNLRPKQTSGAYGWHVDARIDEVSVEADFDVLVWSDIVRDSMDQGIIGTYLLLARTAWTYISSGVLWRLMRLRKGPIIAALYPVGFLLLQLLLALALAGVAAWGLSFIHPLAAIAGVIVIWPVLEWFRKRDNKFFAYYLMHDYAYSAQSNGANPPELEARIAEFVTTIREALKEDLDEVLVVGHSSGAHLGVNVLADLLRKGLPEGAAPLNFLSLGQVVPMVSFLPDADRLRRDLSFLSAQDEMAWVDVSAPGDGCAFALCDPVAVSGVSPTGKKWPLVLSAAFTQTLSPKKWRELRWRFFRLHFQYMCAFDRPGDYDYFQISAGPRTLRERFHGRKASRSRIETPVSPYVSTDA